MPGFEPSQCASTAAILIGWCLALRRPRRRDRVRERYKVQAPRRRQHDSPDELSRGFAWIGTINGQGVFACRPSMHLDAGRFDQGDGIDIAEGVNEVGPSMSCGPQHAFTAAARARRLNTRSTLAGCRESAAESCDPSIIFTWIRRRLSARFLRSTRHNMTGVGRAGDTAKRGVGARFERYRSIRGSWDRSDPSFHMREYNKLVRAGA